MSGKSKLTFQWAFHAAFAAGVVLALASALSGDHAAFVVQCALCAFAFSAVGNIAEFGRKFFQGWAPLSVLSLGFWSVVLIALVAQTHSGVISPMLAMTAGGFTGLGIGLMTRIQR